VFRRQLANPTRPLPVRRDRQERFLLLCSGPLGSNPGTPIEAVNQAAPEAATTLANKQRLAIPGAGPPGAVRGVKSLHDCRPEQTKSSVTRMTFPDCYDMKPLGEDAPADITGGIFGVCRCPAVQAFLCPVQIFASAQLSGMPEK
jgi:hypothetical protein